MRYVALFNCPDARGIVSQLAQAVWSLGGNIIHADHHCDRSCGIFLTRLEWEMDEPVDARDVRNAFAPVAERLGALWQIGQCPRRGPKPKMVIAVSRQHHCLVDLLMRTDSGEIPAEVTAVLSNHRDLEDWCRKEERTFHYVPVSSKSGQRDWENKWLEILRESGANLLVLAKYMQILSPEFLRSFPDVINIHHSFLPAFRGAKPYHQAYSKGVKLIGATAHYATEDLDEGPIIDQDVMRVSHRDDERDFEMKGQDLERIVLARAVKAHLEHRVLSYAGKTVVFN